MKSLINSPFVCSSFLCMGNPTSPKLWESLNAADGRTLFANKPVLISDALVTWIESCAEKREGMQIRSE